MPERLNLVTYRKAFDRKNPEAKTASQKRTSLSGGMFDLTSGEMA